MVKVHSKNNKTNFMFRKLLKCSFVLTHAILQLNGFTVLKRRLKLLLTLNCYLMSYNKQTSTDIDCQERVDGISCNTSHYTTAFDWMQYSLFIPSHVYLTLCDRLVVATRRYERWKWTSADSRMYARGRGHLIPTLRDRQTMIAGGGWQ